MDAVDAGAGCCYAIRMMQAAYRDEGLRVEISAYAPHAHLGVHRDAESRISLPLSGCFAEGTDAGEAAFAPGDILFKSRAVSHEDRFGEAGARIFSVVFTEDTIDHLSGVRFDGVWRRASGARALRLGATLIETARAKDGRGLHAAAADLLGDCGEGAQADAPPWLRRLKDELETKALKDVDVGERADAAGVHSAHLSRLFRRCFGASLTEHAQFHSVRRALGNFADNRVPLSAIALDAGFYDQSHMNRVFRRVLGRTPSECRRLFTAC